MEDMRKLNEGEVKHGQTVGGNDIWRKFRRQFSKLFDANEMARSNKEFVSFYVNDTDFEEQMKMFQETDVDEAKFCVGYTGIGKTTSIRYCLDLGINNQAKIDVERKRIVFPTFLDGYQAEDAKRIDLSKRIAAVCTAMEERHPELRRLLETFEGKKEFYDFVSRHTGFILENVDPVDAMDMEEKQLLVKKLKEAYKQNPFEYQANRMKFYIMKKNANYEQLFILLDDIESLPEDCQREIVAKYLKLYECMKNTDYPEDKNYNIKLLISVRPYTYRLFHSNRQIETFPISEPVILKRKAVDLDQLFKNRFDYYTKQEEQVAGNVETWEQCYQEVQKMNAAFGGKYKDMIINLCFFSTRAALSSYAKVFANRFWVQKNKMKEDKFSIIPTDYSFNNISVIRALGCNEESMYWNEENSVIPNIFYTTSEEDLSVQSILLLKYFERKRNNEYYGINSETIFDIKRELSVVFSTDDVAKFYRCIELLFECKVLRKSIYDIDDLKNLDKKESLSDDSMLYISPRGTELYEMFKRDSVLLEMLREDVWRDYSGWNYIGKTSNELMQERKEKELYMDLLEYIDYLAEKESDIFDEVRFRYKEKEYRNLFGKKTAVGLLLCGVEKSLIYTGIMQDPEIKENYERLKERVGFL